MDIPSLAGPACHPMSGENGPSTNRSIACRLFLFTAAVTLLLSLSAILIQVFFQYRGEIRKLQATLELIEKVHVPTIADNLFTLSEEKIALQIQGLLNFPYISYAEVREEVGNYPFSKSLGTPVKSEGIQRRFELYHSAGLNDGPLFLGYLTVHADYVELRQHLHSSAGVVALTTFSQIFVTASLLFFLVQRSVTRHLVRLADYANRLAPNRLEEPPPLEDSSGLYRQPDEIKNVVAALNDLRLRLREDIRQRERMNRQLRESEERFRSLTDNLPVGVFRVSPEDRVAFVNPAMARMFGFDSPREMEGRNPGEFYRNPEDRVRLRPLWDGLPSMGPLEIECLRNDGAVFWGALRAARFQDPAGNLIAIDGTLEDVTPRRKAETAARRRNRELETLYQMGQEAAEGLSLERTLGVAAERLQSVLPADLVLIFLENDGQPSLAARTSFASSRPWEHRAPFAIDQCLCGQAWRTGESLFSPDVPGDPRCTRDECAKAGIRSFAAIPLKTRDKNLGVLGLAALRETDFRSYQPFLETVAGALAINIHNIRLYQSLEKNAKELQKRLKDLEISRKMLRITENRFRSFFNSNPEGVLLLDFDGVIQDANRAAREITGYGANHLHQRRLTELAAYESREDLKGLLGNLSSGSLEEIPLEILCRRADGPEFPAAIRSWRIRDRDGTPLALGIFLRDLSEEKYLTGQKAALERQLQHTQKMEAIGTLTGGVAHDFNNILGGIIGFAELAVEYERRDPNRLPHFHRRLLEACVRARELVDQILKFGRRESAALQPVCLSPLVNEVVQFLHSSLPATLEIVGATEAEKDWALADASQLHQVLVNLCTNAYHAMRPGPGRLTVALRNITVEKVHRFYGLDIQPGEYAALEVTDTGPGIPAPVRDRIFEPYFTTKPLGEGTGLGLSVSFAIVKSHRGLIEFDSREGEGTTFRVYLPLSEPKADPARSAATKTPGGNGERVLVVDDELFFLDVVREHLETLDYDPVGFQNSARALQSFQAHPDYFDLVITDQTMPKMTGVQLIQEIRRVRSDIPVILCTGFSETVSEPSVKQFGISRFLMKPVHRATLAQTIFDLLEERRKSGPDSGH